MYWTIAVGNVFDGIRLVGIFSQATKAVDFAQEHFNDEPWIVHGVERTTSDAV